MKVIIEIDHATLMRVIMGQVKALLQANAEAGIHDIEIHIPDIDGSRIHGYIIKQKKGKPNDATDA